MRRYNNFRYIKLPYNGTLANNNNEIKIRLYSLFLDILLLVSIRLYLKLLDNSSPISL